MSLRIAALLGTGAMAAAGEALAQTSPQWAEAPSVADFAAAYPAKARAAGVGGAVNLTCTINHEGRPRDCYAIGETPTGYGFGFAARQLAEKMRSVDASANGGRRCLPRPTSRPVFRSPRTA